MGSRYFKPDWFGRYDANDDAVLKNRAVARFVGTRHRQHHRGNLSAYSALVVGDVMPNYTMPIRYVSRKKLEFPELVEWVTEEVYPFYYDGKLEAVFIENAAAGRNSSSSSGDPAPSWLAHRVIGVKPNRGPNGKEAGWKNAALWAKRGMTPLPEPSDKRAVAIRLREGVICRAELNLQRPGRRLLAPGQSR